MNDDKHVADIKALRDALANPIRPFEAVRIDELNPDRVGAYLRACSPDRIARLLDALEAAQKDAERWRVIRDRVYIDPSARILRIADTFLHGGDSVSVADKLTAAIDAAMKEAP